MLLGSAEKKLMTGFATGAGAGAGGGGGGGTFFLHPAAETSKIADIVSSVALRLYIKMSNSPGKGKVFKLQAYLLLYFTVQHLPKKVSHYSRIV